MYESWAINENCVECEQPTYGRYLCKDCLDEYEALALETEIGETNV